MSASDHPPVEAVVDAVDPQVEAARDISNPEGERARGSASRHPAQSSKQPPWWSRQPSTGTGTPAEGPVGLKETTEEARLPRVRTIQRPQMIHFPDRADPDEPRPADDSPTERFAVAPPRPPHAPLPASPPPPDCCCDCPAKSWCQIPCGHQCDGTHPKKKRPRKQRYEQEISKGPHHDTSETDGNSDPKFSTADVPHPRPTQNSQALLFLWRDLDIRWRFVIFNGSAAEIGREGRIVNWATQKLTDAAEQTSVGTAVGIGIAACAACHLLIDRRVANWPGYVRWFFRIPLASMALSVLLYAPGTL